MTPHSSPSPADRSTAGSSPLTQGRAQSPAPITRRHNGQLPPERLAALTAACLLIDDARIYGLIDDAGPYIDRARCRRLLAKLKSEGVVPGQEEIEQAALELMAELGTVRP